MPTLPAADMERAKKYYREKLGFTPVKEMPEGVFYESGATSFMLFPSPNAGKCPTTYAGWEVNGIEATVADLKAKGVVFEEYDTPSYMTVNGIATMGSVKAAWFKDSEGNILAISQM
ncbi:VOC family protein [Candidatus Saccharibacteria bacterium]|nr:VOC family protein [Candidatus Saccharibacteria bacterium]